ncbi:MAG TPA: hypothetical protein VHH88_02220 [Verrucomicrobiae bacterium]|nr:hypothetical protein [Verrucomicrobiae bacterium]
MRVFFREYQRRSLIPLLTLGLVAYYIMVYLPVRHRAESLDAPLRHAWKRLAATVGQTNTVAIDFLHITNQLAETRQALAILDAARQKAAARIELAPVLRAKLAAPFELVDYQNERSKEMDELLWLGKENQVTIEAPVFTGYPEHTVDVKEPKLLWPALAFANGLARAAVECKVEALHSLDVPLALTNDASYADPGGVVEIPIELEFSSSLENALKLLRMLPLKVDEARAAGFTNAPPEKPVLLIDRLFIKKQTPEKPDDARIFLRAVGYVARGEPQ